MRRIVSIDLSNPMAIPLMGYLESLPFVSVEKEKKTFEEAAKECDAISVDEFFTEVRRRINEHYDKLKNA